MNYKIIREVNGSVDIIHTDEEPIDLVMVFPTFRDCKHSAISLIDKKIDVYMAKIKMLQANRVELISIKKQNFNIY